MKYSGHDLLLLSRPNSNRPSHRIQLYSIGLIQDLLGNTLDRLDVHLQTRGFVI